MNNWFLLFYLSLGAKLEFQFIEIGPLRDLHVFATRGRCMLGLTFRFVLALGQFLGDILENKTF